MKILFYKNIKLTQALDDLSEKEILRNTKRDLNKKKKLFLKANNTRVKKKKNVTNHEIVFLRRLLFLFS